MTVVVCAALLLLIVVAKLLFIYHLRSGLRGSTPENQVPATSELELFFLRRRGKIKNLLFIYSGLEKFVSISCCLRSAVLYVSSPLLLFQDGE